MLSQRTHSPASANIPHVSCLTLPAAGTHIHMKRTHILLKSSALFKSPAKVADCSSCGKNIFSEGAVACSATTCGDSCNKQMQLFFSNTKWHTATCAHVRQIIPCRSLVLASKWCWGLCHEKGTPYIVWNAMPAISCDKSNLLARTMHQALWHRGPRVWT